MRRANVPPQGKGTGAKAPAVAIGATVALDVPVLRSEEPAMNDISARPSFATTNPATLAAGKTYAGHSAEEAARKARLAAGAQRDWRRVGFERARRAA